jgi:hypothetical protein
MHIGLTCPLFWPAFNETFNFLDRISQKIQTSNFMKIRPVEKPVVPCERTDRQRHMTKVIVAFSDSVTAPTNTDKIPFLAALIQSIKFTWLKETGTE